MALSIYVISSVSPGIKSKASLVSFGAYLLTLRGVGAEVSLAEHSLKGRVLEVSLAAVSDGMATPLQRGWQVHHGLEPAGAGSAAVGNGITLL